MRCAAIFFLLVGAFLMEWSTSGFRVALHELKVYWRTRDYCDKHTDEEHW